MSTEKILCLAAMSIAGILTLLFVLDAATAFPFGRGSVVFDILVGIAGAIR